MNDIAADTYITKSLPLSRHLRGLRISVPLLGASFLKFDRWNTWSRTEERCVDDARNHGHTLRALLNFNYYEGTDRGSGVREKAKQLIEMLTIYQD
jgi:hypothetical protein